METLSTSLNISQDATWSSRLKIPSTIGKRHNEKLRCFDKDLIDDFPQSVCYALVRIIHLCLAVDLLRLTTSAR
jgi:hypothetical protein